jgi:hypothetical protein
MTEFFATGEASDFAGGGGGFGGGLGVPPPPKRQCTNGSILLLRVIILIPSHVQLDKTSMGHHEVLSQKQL